MILPTSCRRFTCRPLTASLSRYASAPAICAALVIASSSISKAQTLNWDPAGDRSNSGGLGTWNLTSLFWNDDGTAPNVAWQNGSTAVFSGAGDFVTIDTGPLGTGISAGNLIFNTGGYTINSDEASELLTLTGATPTITVSNDLEIATISSTIAGANGLTKAGNGILTLTGTNTYSGQINVSGGTLEIGAIQALGNANEISINTGGKLRIATAADPTKPLTMNGGTFEIATAAGNRRINAPVTLAAGTNSFMHIENAPQILFIGGNTGSANVVSGSGNLTLTGSTFARSVFVLENTANTISGTITLGDYASIENNPRGGSVAGRTIGTADIVIQGINSRLDMRDHGAAARTALDYTINDLTVIGDFASLVASNGDGATNIQNVFRMGNLSIGSGTFTESAADGYTFDFASLTLTGTPFFELQTGNAANNGAPAHVRIRGAVTDGTNSFGITKTGPGILALDGVVTLDGDINVTNGTVRLGNTSATPNQLTGVLTVSQGVLDAAVGIGGGTNSIGTSTVNLNGGTFRVSPSILALGPTTPGFLGKYYNVAPAGSLTTGADFGGTPAAVRYDSIIDTTPGGGFLPVPTIAGVNTTNVIAQWSGALNITAAGDYIFETRSDDGSVLYIDGRQVVFNDAAQGVTTRGNMVPLTAGYHAIVVKFAQGTGGGEIHANYTGPDTGGISKPIGSVPNTVVSPDAGLAVTIGNNLVVSFTSVINLPGVDVTNTGTLTMNSSSDLQVTSLTGGNTYTQAGPVVIDGFASFSPGVGNDSANLVISGNISELSQATLLKGGTRTLRLSGVNQFTGGIIVSGGTLIGNSIAFANNVIDNSAEVTFEQSTDGTYGGALNGAGTYRKTGAGKLSLTGISSGNTLNVDAGTLGGTGSFTGIVTVNAGAKIAGTPAGAFTVGGLVLNAGAAADFTLTSPSAIGQILDLGSLTASKSKVNILGAGPLSVGSYRLIDYDGIALTAPQFAGLTLGSTPGGTRFYSLVNNVAGTALDLAVEAVGPSNTWTGATNSTWDMITANWTTGAFANGQQVTFPDGPANRTLAGPDVAPQRIEFTNNIGNDYVIGNNVVGTVAAGLVRGSNGRATFNGSASVAGPITVTGGQLVFNGQLTSTGGANISGGGSVRLANASMANPNGIGGTWVVGAGSAIEANFGGTRPGLPGSSGTSSLGDATVQLDGGSLLFFGAAYDGGAGGLTGQYYNQQVQRNSRIEFQTLGGINALFNTSTPEATTGGFLDTVGTIDYGNAYGNNAPFNAAGGPGAPNPGVTAADNIMATWKGKFVAPTTTTYTFAGNSDDGLMLFIDGQLVVNRNNFQASSAAPTAGTISLAAGTHDIFAAFYEGGGGAGVRVYENAPATEAAGDPLDLADLIAAQPQTVLGNNVILNASSTVAADNTYGVTLGALTANTAGSTLTTGRVIIPGQPSPDGLVRFTGTTFTAPGNYTINAQSDVALGSLNDGVNAITLIKTGPSNLILDNTSTISDSNGTIISIQAGRLVASGTTSANNPLGTALVKLDAAGTILQLNRVETGTGAASFGNSVEVNDNARIESMRHGGAGGDVILGSGTNTLAIAANKTLEINATAGANLRIDSPISGAGANLLVTASNDPGQGQAFLLLNGANTFTGKVTIQSGTNVRLDNANALKTQSYVDLAANGRLEFFASNSFSSSSPRIISRPGSFFRLNAATNPGQVFGSGIFDLPTGRVLEMQSGNPQTGAGIVRHAPGAIFSNTGGSLVLFPLATTTVGLRGSDLRPLDLFRVVNTINGAGDGVINAGWGSTTAGTIFQINGADRTIANSVIQELNGQLLTNDGANRSIGDGNRLDVGVAGGTIAASTGTTLTVLENLQTDTNSGKLTIGANIPLDNRISNGTVVFANATDDFSGTTLDASKAISVINGAILEGRVSATGASGFGSSFANSLGVALDRGTLRAVQPATPVTGATYLDVGKVFATGAATLAVNRGTAAAGGGNITEMRLNAPIDRSLGSTISLFSQNNVLGTDERVRFANLVDAPVRLTIVGPTTLNMVAPFYLNASGNVGSFVDYNPAQDPGTGPGFVNTTYTSVATEADLVAGSIVDVLNPTLLTGDHTVAAARIQATLDGSFTLTSQTGGIIVTTGAAVGQTVGAKLAASPGQPLTIFAGGATGGIHTLNGTLSSDSGLIKFGPRTLILGADNTSTLVGDVVINEGSLVIGSDNRLGPISNKLILNGGNLRPGGDMFIQRPIVVNNGGGQLTNDGNRNVAFTNTISGSGALTINSVNGNNGVNRFIGTSPNTFEGGLLITNGVLEFSRNDQLGALPQLGDFERGYVVISETGTTNAVLRLAANAGAVSTGDRQFTFLGNARIEVAGASDSLTIADEIRGSGGLTKLGPGALFLANELGNGFLGNVVVSAGSLFVRNDLFSGTGTGTVTVSTGALLGGDGAIEGAITVQAGATITPGVLGLQNGVGALRGSSDLTLSTGSTFAWTLGALSQSNPGDDYDTLDVDFGTLTIQTGVSFALEFTGTASAPQLGNTFWDVAHLWADVIDVEGPAATLNFNSLAINNSPWEFEGSFSVLNNGSGVDLAWTPVPEPGSVTLLALGMGTAIGLRRRRPVKG